MTTDSTHKATPEQWRWAEGTTAGSNWALPSCVVELRDTLAALERRVEALEQEITPDEASTPAAAPAAHDDAWQEFLQELHSLQERALREGIGPRCDMVEWARLLWNDDGL